MTDHTLARADEVLTELVELVETARTLPMSSACVIPRERTLDLLDALREVLPPEMIEARRLVAQRDHVLAQATELAERKVVLATSEAETLSSTARAEAEALTTAARDEAEQLVTGARIQAHELVQAGEAEQAHLVSAASVQQAAIVEAARLHEEAQAQAAAIRAQAEQYAEKLANDAHGYASATLVELVGNLQRLLATAENGRDALAGNPHDVEPEPSNEPVGDEVPAAGESE